MKSRTLHSRAHTQLTSSKVIPLYLPGTTWTWMWEERPPAAEERPREAWPGRAVWERGEREYVLVSLDELSERRKRDGSFSEIVVLEEAPCRRGQTERCGYGRPRRQWWNIDEREEREIECCLLLLLWVRHAQPLIYLPLKFGIFSQGVIGKIRMEVGGFPRLLCTEVQKKRMRMRGDEKKKGLKREE